MFRGNDQEFFSWRVEANTVQAVLERVMIHLRCKRLIDSRNGLIG